MKTIFFLVLVFCFFGCYDDPHAIDVGGPDVCCMSIPLESFDPDTYTFEPVFYVTYENGCASYDYVVRKIVSSSYCQ